MLAKWQWLHLNTKSGRLLSGVRCQVKKWRMDKGHYQEGICSTNPVGSSILTLKMIEPRTQSPDKQACTPDGFDEACSCPAAAPGALAGHSPGRTRPKPRPRPASSAAAHGTKLLFKFKVLIQDPQICHVRRVQCCTLIRGSETLYVFIPTGPFRARNQASPARHCIRELKDACAMGA